MSKQRQFSSVWDAIEDTPQKAASMRARSELLMALQEWVKTQNRTQVEAARILGVTQPRMSDLARGRIHLFSLDVLMDMAMTAGLSPHIAFKRPKAPKKKTPTEAQAV
jgi:predicted XRE-type DNA-binding protein